MTLDVVAPQEAAKELARLIADDAARQLRAWGAEISPNHYRGLWEPAEFIGEMAFGTKRARKRTLALSSMSTGMGKSEIAAATGRVLTNPLLPYGDIGMIVYVNTIRDLKAMIKRMGFKTRGYDPRYAVFTGKKNAALNKLGAMAKQRGGIIDPSGRENAQVLFVTQAKFLWWASYLPSAFMRDFYYRGRRRQVAIWDETILPIDTLTLVPEQLENFAHELLKRRFAMAAEAVLAFADNLKKLEGGEVIQMPRFELDAPHLLGLAKRGKRLEPQVSTRLLPCFKTGEMLLSPEGEFDIETEFNEVCSALMWLRGKKARTYRDKFTQSAVISYRDILPETIGPLLVLDANADQRQGYTLMREGGWPIVELHSPKRDYRNLGLIAFDRPAGRNQHKKLNDRKPLIELAADAFFREQEKGERDVLLLHYKANIRKSIPNMLQAVRREIKRRGGNHLRLKGLHYGNERATNKYRDVCAVIALGVQQAPLYQIIADVRGIKGLPPHADVDPDTVKAHRRAEQMATFFQGISRTAIRKITADGGVPPGTTVCLIASSQGSMPFPYDMLEEWLPGVKPIMHQETPKLRSGKHRADGRVLLVELLKARAGGEPFGYGSFPGILRRNVKYYLTKGNKDGIIGAALAAEGLKLETLPRRPGGANQWRVVREGVDKNSLIGGREFFATGRVAAGPSPELGPSN